MTTWRKETALAQAALAHYGRKAGRLTLLARRSTTLYRVDMPGGNRYVLRLYPHQQPPRDKLASELAWLLALKRDTDLAVPAPVANSAGEHITVFVPQPGFDQIHAVLFGWLTGRFYQPASLRPPLLRELGRCMATLHNHAANFVPPPDFTRPYWHPAPLFGPGAPIHRAAQSDLIAPGDMSVFTAASERAYAEAQALEGRPGLYGLIHGDLQYTNYLFAQGKVQVIDFGDCGFGYYAFDMAVMLADLFGLLQEAALRAAFFTGYTAVRALPPDYEDLLRLFTVYRMARRINFLLGGSDPKQRDLAPAWFARTTRLLREYVEG